MSGHRTAPEYKEAFVWRLQNPFQLRRDKLIEAIIYLSERSADDPNFGVIKLAKLLYYADCAAYLKHGAPITGVTYLHFPHGPYPEHWYKVRREMQPLAMWKCCMRVPATAIAGIGCCPSGPSSRRCLPTKNAPFLTSNVSGCPVQRRRHR